VSIASTNPIPCAAGERPCENERRHHAQRAAAAARNMIRPSQLSNSPANRVSGGAVRTTSPWPRRCGALRTKCASSTGSSNPSDDRTDGKASAEPAGVRAG
jgi:hypothetical protein